MAQIKSIATLPDGREVVLTWDRGDCVGARRALRSRALGLLVADEELDLMFILGGREQLDAWLDERTEDETLEDE